MFAKANNGKKFMFISGIATKILFYWSFMVYLWTLLFKISLLRVVTILYLWKIFWWLAQDYPTTGERLFGSRQKIIWKMTEYIQGINKKCQYYSAYSNMFPPKPPTLRKLRKWWKLFKDTSTQTMYLPYFQKNKANTQNTNNVQR